MKAQIHKTRQEIITLDKQFKRNNNEEKLKLALHRDILRYNTHTQNTMSQEEKERKCKKASSFHHPPILFLRRCLKIKRIGQLACIANETNVFLSQTVYLRDNWPFKFWTPNNHPQNSTHECQTGQKSGMLQELRYQPRLLHPAVYDTLYASGDQLSSKTLEDFKSILGSRKNNFSLATPWGSLDSERGEFSKEWSI